MLQGENGNKTLGISSAYLTGLSGFLPLRAPNTCSRHPFVDRLTGSKAVKPDIKVLRKDWQPWNARTASSSPEITFACMISPAHPPRDIGGSRCAIQDNDGNCSSGYHHFQTSFAPTPCRSFSNNSSNSLCSLVLSSSFTKSSPPALLSCPNPDPPRAPP